jgi:sortase A
MLLNKHNLSRLLILLFTFIVAWQWGQAAFIYSKAHLAKWMISHAWEKTLHSHTDTKPWPWADTWPVAKITFPGKKSYYILAGGAGNSLAFGPGHLSDTPLPGSTGTSVIGGHRDTHFSLLKNIKENEHIEVQNKKGQWKTYQVNQRWIADSQKEPLLVDQSLNQLYLITCYPFNAINPRGTQRFIVKAEEVN